MGLMDTYCHDLNTSPYLFLTHLAPRTVPERLWTGVSTRNRPLTWTTDPELWLWSHNPRHDRSDHNVTPYLWSRAWHHSLSMMSSMTSSSRPLPHGSYLWLSALCPNSIPWTLVELDLWHQTLYPDVPLYIRVANWSHTTPVCCSLTVLQFSPLCILLLSFGLSSCLSGDLTSLHTQLIAQSKGATDSLEAICAYRWSPLSY